MTFIRLFVATFVEELATRNNTFDDAVKSIPILSELAAHLLDRRFIGDREASAQGVREQFAAEIVGEIVLPALADVAPQAFETGSFAAAGERGGGIDRTPGEILLPAFADRAEAFEDQPERLEAGIAGGAIG